MDEKPLIFSRSALSSRAFLRYIPALSPTRQHRHCSVSHGEFRVYFDRPLHGSHGFLIFKYRSVFSALDIVLEDFREEW